MHTFAVRHEFMMIHFFSEISVVLFMQPATGNITKSQKQSLIHKPDYLWQQPSQRHALPYVKIRPWNWRKLSSYVCNALKRTDISVISLLLPFQGRNNKKCFILTDVNTDQRPTLPFNKILMLIDLRLADHGWCRAYFYQKKKRIHSIKDYNKW